PSSTSQNKPTIYHESRSCRGSVSYQPFSNSQTEPTTYHESRSHFEFILNNENTRRDTSSQQASPQYETEPEAEPSVSQQADLFSSQCLSQEDADELF
ncbi:2744_t:CDS:2, partial [Racocetra persica]